MKNILVFKTSVYSSRDLSVVEPLLDGLLDKTERWSFDLEDCDRILRVEAVLVDPNAIVRDFEKAGFLCAELPE